MKKIILIILILSHGLIIAQPTKYYHFKWSCKDTIRYNVLMGEVNANISSSYSMPVDQQTKKQVELRNDSIRKLLIDEFKNTPVTSMIFPAENEFKVLLQFGNFPIMSSSFDSSGVPKKNVEKEQENLFKFFFALPKRHVKIGDSWKSNIDFNITLNNMTIINKERQDKTILKSISKADNEVIATFETSVYEKIKLSYIDENEISKTCNLILSYKATNEFDVNAGNMKHVDGIISLNSDLEELNNSISHIGIDRK